MTKTLEIRVRPVTRYVVTRYESDGLPRGAASCGTLGEFDSPARADEVALAIRASEPHARVVTSDGTVHGPVELQFVITKVNTFDVQNEVYFASTAEEAAAQVSKLAATHAEAQWQVFSRPKHASTQPAVAAIAHDWRVSASYGGELCANCGAVKGSRRSYLGCGERASSAQKLAVTDEMVTRFLGWQFPEDFSPDGGIVFNRPAGGGARPVGTNLLHFGQAKAMLEHCLNGPST
jgi:hypothetical protein